MQTTIHSKSAQFTLDTASAAIRETTWQTLCKHHAHLSWPPHLIDAALNHVTDPCASYQELCTIAAAAPVRDYPHATSVAVTALFEAPRDPGRALLTPFLLRLGRKVASHLKIIPTFQLRDEIEELVTAHYFAMAVRFQTCGEYDGNIVTYGYEAFQMTMSRSCVRQAGRILHHHAPTSLDAAKEDAGYEPSYAKPMEPTSEVIELREKLISGLRHALTEPLAWEMIHSMAYRDCTQGEVATKLGKNRKTLSGAVATTIKQGLQNSLATGFGLPKGNSASVAAIAKGLAGVFSEDEFCTLIPSPIVTTQETNLPAIELPIPVLHQTSSSNVCQDKDRSL